MSMRMALVFGAVLTLTACGSVDGGPTASGGASSTDSQPPAPSTSFTEDLTVTSRPGSGRPITVRGTVTEGVEAGCLTISDGQGTWTLVGATADLKAGATVTIRGTVRDDIATICQQGPALWVDEVLDD